MVSIKLNEQLLESFIDEYKDYSQKNNGEYVYFFAKKDDLVITLYHSKKGYKAVFSGSASLDEARKWDKDASISEPKKKINAGWLSFEEQIGSDEVGVGDFLLPLIVVAAYVDEDSINTLIETGIKDSKKLKDDDILRIVPTIINKVKVSKLTLSNEKYNSVILNGDNLNAIKAKMHNSALLNLKTMFPHVKNIFVDQFAKEETYYKYLSLTKNVVRNITFKTKGETYYPCVAVASMVARYFFLKEKQKLEEKYGLTFPFGAGSKANQFAINFIQKFGLEEFDKIAKKNFANYSEVIKLI